MYESAPHYCVMILIDDALFESGSVYWFMLFFFIASELVSKG